MKPLYETPEGYSTLKPTFVAMFLCDGSTAFRCRETGERFIVSDLHNQRDDCGVYHEGRLIFTGPRVAAINAVESAARWGMRTALCN